MLDSIEMYKQFSISIIHYRAHNVDLLLIITILKYDMYFSNAVLVIIVEHMTPELYGNWTLCTSDSFTLGNLLVFGKIAFLGGSFVTTY